MAKDAYGELSTDQEIKRGKLSIEDLIESTQVSEGSRPEKSGIGKQTMLDYFGFRSHPFADSLDLSFFYKSNGHEMALIKMQMSIEHDISFGLVTGKSGTGKTMISQALLERLSLKRFKPVLILATPHLSPGAFLKIIIKELTGEKDALLPRDLHSLVEKTSQTLLSYYQDGIKPVILIDETHFLS
ncbi:MAG: AAA family ATPase, partial [Candidatus Aureabacteria bacterium]|nr:AAA family ATPase [Candidatus Auribacterota bacterium]